jgi:hypothetical protein
MDKDLLSQVEHMFAGLNDRSASQSLPKPGTLSDLLDSYVVKSEKTTIVPARSKVLTTFATAAVEMWLRSVHSFLISVSLTDASPIWSSVSGYYSSHYSVRAFAHLLGAFQLHKLKRIVYVEKDGNHFVLRIEKKQRDDGEHKFYWKFVSEHSQLASDPFFYPNLDDLLRSDGSHRNKANYTDHIDQFPVFLPLNAEFLEKRVEWIASVVLSDVPVPRLDPFPDIVSVQFVAYHRLVKFRRFLNEVLDSKNRFWSVHKNPSWRPNKLKFSVVDPVFAALYAGR